jgi:predicted phosphoadenosine phosphosulfate sulfurtransferase
MAYIETWEKRCYSDGIPDSIPEKLAKSGRAPSYKSIAMAMLRNDHNLEALGFSGKYSDWYSYYKKIEISKNNKIEQFSLFD